MWITLWIKGDNMTKYGDVASKRRRRVHTYASKEYQMTVMLDKYDMNFIEHLSKKLCITKGEIVRRALKLMREEHDGEHQEGSECEGTA
jgi:hypothetical protein